MTFHERLRFSRAGQCLLEVAGWRVALSPQILAELADKLRTREPLRRWLKNSDQEIEEFLVRLPLAVSLIPGSETATGAVPADPKDDMIIAAAVESGASYSVSEDHHLREIKEHQGVKILGIDEFKAGLGRLGVVPTEPVSRERPAGPNESEKENSPEGKAAE